MSTITIVKGEEFKISVKEKIEENDIFFEEYQRAAAMLDEIAGAAKKEKDLGRKWSWRRGDFENNIIAFCGERGEGKSSAMLTFVNAVCQEASSGEGIFASCKNLQGTYFAEPVLIDPSLFDDVHNVLDIVLAKIFHNFYDKYQEDGKRDDARRREELLDQFQKVYRRVSLINNQKQMLDDEFDYEGNISKLSKLGESAGLKEELTKLILDYLRFMGQEEKEKYQLVLAIDDLDLCSSNAYKMAEQIRKYLVIPHVSIVMSVRVEQLEMCIREQNLRDFGKIYESREEGVYRQLNSEVQTMAERYVSKLIPRQRRIYLSGVQSLRNVQIIYKDNDRGNVIWDSGEPKYSDTFLTAVLDLVYNRTGMFFSAEQGGRYLLPDNLRDMISWIVMVADLKQPESSHFVYADNIRAVGRYLVREWAKDERYDGLMLQDVGEMDHFRLHVAARKILEGLYAEVDKFYGRQAQPFAADRADSMFQVMGLFENLAKSVVDVEKESCVYRLRTLYTIEMSSLFQRGFGHEIAENGYIWGPWFCGVLPAHFGTGMDRSRFQVGTIQAYNLILQWLCPEAELLEMPESGKQYRVAQIGKGENREAYITAWIVLGMFSNVFYYNNNQTVFSSTGNIIFDNSMVCEFVHISLENYLIGLCDLYTVYEKVNLEILGVSYREFEFIADGFNENNPRKIQYVEELFSSMDLMLGIKEYCVRHRDYKKRTEDEKDRSMKLLDRFFSSLTLAMRYFKGEKRYGSQELKTLYFPNLSCEIDVSALYAEFFELCIQNIPLLKQLEENRKVEELVSGFRKKLIEIPEIWNREEIRVPRNMRKLTAGNVKANLDSLASRVQKYLGEQKSQPETLDVEGLCNLYGDVARICLKNKDAMVAQESYEEYKRLVKVMDEVERAQKIEQ